jgi:MATE family multidrug resistance protein
VTLQSTLTEVRRTLTLAFPIIVGHLSQMLMGITDSVMIGRIGAVELAASAFANVLFTVSFITGIGILMSVSVLVARAHGAKQSRDCAEYLRHGIWLGVGLALAGMAMMFGAALRLDHFGQPAEVVAAVEPYLQLIAFSLVPTLLFQVFRQFSEAVGHPWGPMAILLGGVALNVVLNWVLIYGNLGAPALGLAGAGWATLIARITAATVLWLWLRQRSEVRAEWPARNANPRWFAPISRSHLRAMFGIGIPAAGQLLFEAGAFAAAALMMGWIGTIALAAHQIALNCAACVFMVPLGLSIATSVRIGRAVGENNAAALRPIGFGSLATGVCFAVVFTVIFALAGKFIVAGFTHDTAVVADRIFSRRARHRSAGRVVWSCCRTGLRRRAARTTVLRENGVRRFVVYSIANRFRRSCVSSLVRPSIRTRFSREEPPVASVTADLGRRRVVARKRQSSVLALPSTGGALSRTFSTSPIQPTTSLRAALGTALMVSRQEFMRYELPHAEPRRRKENNPSPMRLCVSG